MLIVSIQYSTADLLWSWLMYVSLEKTACVVLLPESISSVA